MRSCFDRIIARKVGVVASFQLVHNFFQKLLDRVVLPAEFARCHLDISTLWKYPVSGLLFVMFEELICGTEFENSRK